METAIRWCQRSTPADPTFLIIDVAGRTFKHCRITSSKGSSLQWEEISKNSKVPSFRAFDWNFLHNVVAIGQWSGEATVLRLENDQPTLSLRIKSERACNAVTFNSESLLATGLDRVRNDFCLNVYNIVHWAGNQQSNSLQPRQSPGAPVRKLATSEGITSIKFFLEQPNVLVAGVKGTCVRIYDLRENSGNPALQYQTTCVHNIAVDPCDANYFASAGQPRDCTVQLWDRRSTVRPTVGSGSFGSQFSSPDVPLLELKDVFKSQSDGEASSIWSIRYSIASPGSLGILGSGGVVRIFEMKKDWLDAEDMDHDGYSVQDLAQPVSISRTEAIGRTCPQSQRNSGPRSIDIMDSERVLAFDFINVLSSNRRPAAITLYGDQEIKIRELHARAPALASTFSMRASVAVGDIKGKVHDGISFIQAPSDGTISEALAAIQKKLETRSRISKHRPSTVAEANEDNDQSTMNDGWNDDAISTSSSPIKQVSQNASALGKKALMGSFEDALIMSEKSRRRCLEGYLFDADKNVQLVKEDFQLRWMWQWIGVAKRNAESRYMSNSIVDFNYLGVQNLWNSDIGTDPSLRLRSGITSEDISQRIVEHERSLELPPIDLPETSKPSHRRLCLFALGFDPTSDVLLARVKALALAGFNSEAALHALICSEPSLASTAMRSGPRNTQNKALSLFLSLYTNSEKCRDLLPQLASLAASETDPFINAINSLLKAQNASSGPSLGSVPGLPPLYHIGLALVTLPDGVLRSYLSTSLIRAVDTGDISYIPLTGLSQLCMRLFKRYLSQTGDLQSVALALAQVSPLYIRKPRVDAWRAEYRAQLNRCGLHIRRAQFDMQSTKLATRFDGKSTLEPPARQVSLACANCNGSLHRERESVSVSTPVPIGPHQPMHQLIEGQSQGLPRLPSSASTIAFSARAEDSFEASTDGSGSVSTSANTKPPTSPMGAYPQLFGTPKDGTMCPNCGARLPRCSVCEFWVGETDPRSKGVRADEVLRKELRDSLRPENWKVRGNGEEVEDEEEETGVSDGEKGRESSMDRQARKDDLLKGFVEICLSCTHVYHRRHAREWFGKHTECAAVGCHCRCAEIEGPWSWPRVNRERTGF